MENNALLLWMGKGFRYSCATYYHNIIFNTHYFDHVVVHHVLIYISMFIIMILMKNI